MALPRQRIKNGRNNPMPDTATDEDFKSRYARETLGMPDYLAAAASRNLAAQDSAIGKVNAASRVIAANGGGAPDVAVANAMDNADLSNRIVQGPWSPQPINEAPPPNGIDIAAVNQRRNQILQGIDPDAPAIFVGDKRKRELQQELGALTTVAHEHALETAAQAHQDLVKQRDIDVANQSARIFAGLKDIKPDGKPESEAAVHDLVTNNRTAFDVSPAVREEIKRHALIHDRAAKAAADKVAASEAPITPIVDSATGLAWNGSRWVTPPIVAGADGQPTTQKVPSPIVTTHSKLLGDRASAGAELASATDEFNSAAGHDAKRDAKVKVDAASLKINKIDAHLGTIYDQFPSLSPKAATVTAATAAAPSAPEAGIVRNGYKFKGGNPADKNNWEKQE